MTVEQWPMMPHRFMRVGPLVHIGRWDRSALVTRCQKVPPYPHDAVEVEEFSDGDLCPLCWSGTPEAARVWVATSWTDALYLLPIDDAPARPWPWER